MRGHRSQQRQEANAEQYPRTLVPERSKNENDGHKNINPRKKPQQGERPKSITPASGRRHQAHSDGDECGPSCERDGKPICQRFGRLRIFRFGIHGLVVQIPWMLFLCRTSEMSHGPAGPLALAPGWALSSSDTLKLQNLAGLRIVERNAATSAFVAQPARIDWMALVGQMHL
jgi:hypothetical protein